MKKKMYQDEELLRDKMLRHEFEPDESAWEGMEALLNGVPGPSPTTALPTAVAASSGLLAKVGAWAIWAGGLSLAGLAVVLATKWATPSPTAPRTGVAASPSTPLRSGGNAPHASPAHSTASPDAARPAGQKPTDDQALRSQAPVSPSASAAARQPMKAAPRSEHAAPPALPTPTLPDGPEKGHAALAQPAAAPSEMAAQNTLPSTLTEGKEDFATPVGKSANALPALPSLVQALSGPALQPPTLEQMPAPLITRKHVQRHDQQGRFQVGAALGGQWTVVNRAINKVALLPTYGFSLNARISPRWWAETGLMYRQVKGYDLTAQWRDAGISIDGKYGSWASGVSAKQLNYLEMPLLIKYA
ncbi:MAG TPA: hypothetical protein PK971_05770, partial [Saprospiraceae bacterium]|nr:hypothetical protein [Saprospiraceae bacterium]